MIEEFLNGLKFEDSKLYKKILNLLYVLISKEGNPKEWFILDVIHINLLQIISSDERVMFNSKEYLFVRNSFN